jgi:hypothetical protein
MIPTVVFALLLITLLGLVMRPRRGGSHAPTEGF